MSTELEAYSPQTGKTYRTWDLLVKAEANGYVVLIKTTRPDTATEVRGPYPTKPEALAARVRLRARAARNEAPYKVTSEVRILWKDQP